LIPAQALPFSPETLTAYEAGVKSYLFNRTLKVNVAAFYNNYNDIQLTLSHCLGNAQLPCALPANVGSAHVKGAELELEAHPVGGLEIDGSLSLLNFQYTNIKDPSTFVTKGMITPFTPKTKASFGVQYEIPMGEHGSLTPRLDASYQSSIFTQPINDPFNRIDGYSVANGRLTWKDGVGVWQASLNVTNLTNKLYYLTLFDNHGSVNYVSGQPAMPREWSVSVKRNFN
jgi:iron complex outermembrane recepter protein